MGHVDLSWMPDLVAVQAERGRRRLRYFVRVFAWAALNPSRDFQGNWHIDAMCEHLEAVKAGQVRHLIINIPFRHLKSTVVSQAFPAWDWIDNPGREFMTSSYAMDVATRDAVDSRRIIESELYQAAYGKRFNMVTDQNVKTRYENDKGGHRVVVATESRGTGFGGDILIVDDPVSAKEADSPAALEASIEWWKGTMSTRSNDPKNSRWILVHQRLNTNDLTGYMLAEAFGGDHLVLPMRYDPRLAKTTSLGFVDPRKTEGELLHPSRVDEAAAKEMEKTLGSYHTNAQLQQNPEPRGGSIFSREHWRYYKELPQLPEVAISVDCAFKGIETADYVAIQSWSERGADCFLLPGRIKARMGFAATVQAIRNAVAQQKSLGRDVIAVLIEDKANGPAVIETLKDEIPGVIAVNPEGGKAARAFAMQPSCEAGNIHLPDPSLDATIESFVGTCARFTGKDGGEDDEVDAMTQYVNWKRKRTASSGLLDYYRQHYEAQQRKG